MKKIYILLVMTAYFLPKAQVGINTSTPHSSAALDIVSSSKGVLLPRVGLENRFEELNGPNPTGLMLYNIGGPNSTLPVGFYYWADNTWAQLPNEFVVEDMISSAVSTIPGANPATKFFYMPAIAIDTRTPGTFKRNLYVEYVSQFTNKNVVPNPTTGGELGTSQSGTFIKSTGAPDVIPVIPNATDIYYYITSYDQTALDNLSITDQGVLTYEVIGTGTDYSFINIVFVLK